MTPSDIAWRKSSRCGSNACVEVARDGDDYLLRDGKNRDLPAQRFTQTQWIEFLDGIQAGDFAVM